MGRFRQLLIEKLGVINYKMAIHPGTAKQRLASECRSILLLPEEEIPEQYVKEFCALKEMIKEELSHYPKGLPLANFVGKRQSTAVKYIDLLLRIEWVIRE